MARIVGEVRPKFVFVENSPLLVSRGLGTVLADLAALGYDARWGIISARDAGAPHKRDRIWILANSHLHGNITKVGRCLGEKIAEKSSDRQIHPATWNTTRASDDEREGAVLGLE
jgi:site-specific DNA-cytosine methylase